MGHAYTDNPAHAGGDFDAINLAGVGNDTVNINGSSGADTMTVIANGTVAQASTTGFPIPVSVSGALTLVMKGLGGPDNMSCSGNLARIVPLVLDGGDGDDTIGGSKRANTIYDGNGNDTLMFNGSNLSEILDLSTNSSRLRLTRNVANIAMDVAGVETVNLNALGGADSITVKSLAETTVGQVTINLAPTIGGSIGNAHADAIYINGTAAADAFSLAAFGGVISVAGITPFVQFAYSELANESLFINGLADTDTFSVGAGVTSLIMVTTNQ